MQIIKNNPYRILGLLVGASAAQQNRHISRIPRFLDAGDQIPEEFTSFAFNTLGKTNVTLQSVTEASSKLNLDSDKMYAALFWFFKGNEITDEPAFDYIKEGNVKEAISIWANLTNGKEVDKRNASAFQNLSTLMLYYAFKDEFKPDLFEKGLTRKLKFLESNFANGLKKLATDETFKTTKKELQLIFLNQVQAEVEKSSAGSLNNLLEILIKLEFIAKEDFLKSFAQKPIEQIEKKIEEVKSKRKANKKNGVVIGKSLFEQTNEDLKQLKFIVGLSNVRYSSIADKVANEILQCSIDFFNYYQEIVSDIEYFEPAWELAKSAEAVAIGKITKDRIIESINTLKEMKDREISQAIQLLQSIRDAYEENERKINQQVKELKANDIDLMSGRKTINWSAVEDSIKNSIDWQNVNELLIAVLSDNHLKKIKESDKNELKKEFLELANWLSQNSQKSSTISAIIDKYKKIPPKLPFKIISSEITNTDKDNNPLPLTYPLYKKHTRFVGLKINVECYENRNVTFYIKYIGTNGSLSINNEISPKGYSKSITASINKQTRVIDLSGWGSNSSCVFSVGRHCIEVYFEEFNIYTKNFVIDLAPSEKWQIELKKEEVKLTEIKTINNFESELSSARNEMSRITEWQFLRSDSDKQMQIKYQQQKINEIIRLAAENHSEINKQIAVINDIKSKIKKAEY